VALFAGRRRRLIIAGWGIALSGLLTAIVASHLTVRPADGGPVVVWAGLPLALAALGLLLAAAAGADALGRLLAGVRGWRAIAGGRGAWAALVALVACSAPLPRRVAQPGISGPIHPVSNPVVPELVTVAAGQGRQVRTLVLRSAGGEVSYLLLRGPSPSLARSPRGCSRTARGEHPAADARPRSKATRLASSRSSPPSARWSVPVDKQLATR
jgi:hypothetical protein